MKRAVALRYDDTAPAPFVLAKERGLLAERLIRLAEEYGIAIVEDEALSEALFYVEPGSEIPEPVFEAVAALLAYVYRTRSS